MRRILDGMTLEILVERQREIEVKSASGTEPQPPPASPASVTR
jgi:hypothetical protein